MAKLTEHKQIALDESAAAEPEIEAVKSPEAETEKELDESAAAEGDVAEVGCPVQMGYPAQRCGHKLHIAPDGVDEQPVCLMHSNDPGKHKQAGQLFKEFWLEFEKILKAAGEGAAHFERFVFPQLDFSKREFRVICRFEGADFTQDAHFNEATFTQNAYFGEANFKRRAIFHNATFKQNANFSGATFIQDAIFWSSTFTRNAEFGGATFSQKADLHGATFTQNVSFFKAIFTQYADFSNATFKQNVCFQEATFTQKADFENTEFYGTSDWCRSRFLDQAEFRHTKLLPEKPKTPSAVFSLAKFAKPGEIVFEDVDLSRALFLNCDVSAVWFNSSVKWAERKGHHGPAVFEEEILLNPEFAQLKKGFVKIDHGAVEQIYHQLQKNYDTRLDYRKANDFHYGEMEMRRLASWSLRLSMVAWYRRVSNYGNSYARPAVWIAGLLVVAALVFPLPGLGLERSRAGWVETYGSVWRAAGSWRQGVWWEFVLVLKSFVVAVSLAMFQKNANYTPASEGAYAVAILEMLLTSSVFALFLLAIRRQFRR